MPIPSHLTTKPSFTDGGRPYHTLCEPVREERTASSTLLQLDALVDFDIAEGWVREVVGFTEWTVPPPGIPGESILTRHLPLRAEYRTGGDLYLDSLQLVSNAGPVDAANGADRFSEFDNNWPVAETLRYRMTFLAPRWDMVSDADLRNGLLTFSQREQFRYVTVSVRTNPRERRIPGYGFEVNTNFDGLDPGGRVVPISEVGFVPDYQQEIIATWHQVPVRAYPDAQVLARLATVNDSVFEIGGKTYAAEELLLKGPQSPLEWYRGADGQLYYDVAFTFAFQPGGWNRQPLFKRNGAAKRYAPVRARMITPDQAPYAASGFQALFRPSNP